MVQSKSLVCVQKKIIPNIFHLLPLSVIFTTNGLYRFKKLIFKSSLLEYKTIIFYNFCLKSLFIKTFNNVLSSLNFFFFSEFLKYKELMLMNNLIDHNFVPIYFVSYGKTYPLSILDNDFNIFFMKQKLNSLEQSFMIFDWILFFPSIFYKLF